MAITTLDGVIAGMLPLQNFLKVGTTMEAAGVLHSLFYSSGMPGAAAAPSPGLAGATLTTYAGQIPWTNPGAGNSYLARFSGNATQPGMVLLCDRLWHNSGISITTTTGQTINSTAWGARDNNGAIDGAGIMVGLEVSATLGNGAVTNTTLTYTNPTPTGSRTATISSFPASAQAGTFVPFQLQADDPGIKSIQTLTLGTTYVSGTMRLVAYRVLAMVDVMAANVGNFVDAISGGFPRLFDNTVPFLLFLPTTTTAATVQGQMGVTQG